MAVILLNVAINGVRAMALALPQSHLVHNVLGGEFDRDRPHEQCR